MPFLLGCMNLQDTSNISISLSQSLNADGYQLCTKLWVPCCEFKEFNVHLDIMRQNTKKLVSRRYTWWLAFVDTPRPSLSSVTNIDLAI